MRAPLPGAATAAEDLVGAAAQHAAAAARRAGVRIVPLESPAEMHRAAELFAAVWGTAPGSAPVSAHLLRAVAFTGGYVHGAYGADGDLLAASVGLLADGDPVALHSHISGVAPGAQGRGLGFAVKQDQRAWSLARGMHEVSWTFDPLVRRNAAFNLVKLRATAVRYLVDFYGSMHDQVNAADESDRLLVRWRLDDPAVVAASAGESPEEHDAPAGLATVLSADADGRPVASGLTGDRVVCWVPPGIEQMRRTTPSLARSWRRALRDVLGGAMAAGWRVDGLARSGGYVLARGDT